MSRLKSYKALLAFFTVGYVLAPAVAVESLATNPKAVEISQLWDAGKRSQADRLLNKWRDEEKTSPLPLVQAGVIYVKRRKFNKALSVLNDALEKSPQCAEAYYWRGRSYEELKKPLEAANEFRAALIAQQIYPEAQEALARMTGVLGEGADGTTSR